MWPGTQAASRQTSPHLNHCLTRENSILRVASYYQLSKFKFSLCVSLPPPRKKQRNLSILPDCCASLQASPILFPVRQLNTASMWLPCRDKETSSSIRPAAVSESQREKAFLRSRARMYSLGSSKLASNSLRFPQIASHKVHAKHQCFTTAVRTELLSHQEWKHTEEYLERTHIRL